jgi:hypothetical protein
VSVRNRPVQNGSRTAAAGPSATALAGPVPDASATDPFSDTAGGLLLGYARVSRGDHQSLDMQLDALQQAGCHRISRDEMSGTRDDRPELGAAAGMVGPAMFLAVLAM